MSAGRISKRAPGRKLLVPATSSTEEDKLSKLYIYAGIAASIVPIAFGAGAIYSEAQTFAATIRKHTLESTAARHTPRSGAS